MVVPKHLDCALAFWLHDLNRTCWINKVDSSVAKVTIQRNVIDVHKGDPLGLWEPVERLRKGNVPDCARIERVLVILLDNHNVDALDRLVRA